MKTRDLTAKIITKMPKFDCNWSSRAKLGLSCSFQAAGCGAFGPAVAGVRDSVRPLPDVARGSAEDSRDELRAISSGCRGRSDDIPDLLRASVGDSRRVADVGTPVGCRRLAVDGMENEEKYTRSRHSSRSGPRRLLRDFRGTNL